MSKFLMVAAEVVGAVTLVVASAGALAPVATASFLSSLGVAASASALATIGGLVSAGLGVAAQLAAKKPTEVGSPTEWRANPDQGIDLAIGDVYNAGGILRRISYGKKNKWQTVVTCWSLGPVHSIDTTYVDGRAVTLSGQTVNIEDRGQMFEQRQLGACPEPYALSIGVINPPGWTAAHKLSGKAAIMDTFAYDPKGGTTFTSIPNCGWRGKGLLCYDPRKDSTYPGGNGSHRWDDQSTWEWSDCPPIFGLTFCLGWKQNGKLAGGCGMSIRNILVDQFVEAANVCDVNGWKVGGTKSTADDPHDVLVDILQAGGCELLQLGAKIGCLVNTPRVRLATIDRNCLARGSVIVPAMGSRRTRINGITPTYRFEQEVTTQDSQTGELVTQTSWALAPGVPIVIDEYVTADGKERRKPVTYPLVQCFAGDEPTQIAQLARYDIENAREIDGISLPLKLRWYGYKPGDVVGVDLPEAGLQNRDVLIRNRGLEAGTGVVTITSRTETAAKHAFALGQTTTPPASPSTMPLPDLAASEPQDGDWILTGTTISSATGSIPALSVALQPGHEVDDDVDTVIFETRQHADGQADDAGWANAELSTATVTAKTISAVAGGVAYDVAVSYRSRSSVSNRLILGPATPGDLSAGNSLQQAVFNSYIVEVQNGGTVVNVEADGTLTIKDHTRRYPDGHSDVAVTGATIATGVAADTTKSIGYDDPEREGGAVTYNLYDNDSDAHASANNPGRHYVGYFTVPSSGSSGGGGGGVGGGGGRKPLEPSL